MHLRSVQSLELFVASAYRDATIGHAVEDLTISLTSDCPSDAVRQCLRLSKNVESLILNLPHSCATTLLDGIQLPRMQLLSTNLPHDSLVSFLARHRGLRSLVLRYCGKGWDCPLRHISLAHIVELQCPSRCLPAIASDKVARATVNVTRLASNAVLAIHALARSPLYCLTIDFLANDYDMLQKVAAAAPKVKKLKLVEKPWPQVSSSSDFMRYVLSHCQQRRKHQMRRSWNDIRAWHQALLRLPCLEELALQALVHISTVERPEARIITGWANGSVRRATPHPSLYHIALLQPTLEPLHFQQTEWFKASPKGTWECTASIVGTDLEL